MAMKRLMIVGLALACMGLQGCSMRSLDGESYLSTAGNAFMEGFLPSKVQIQRAASYPGYIAGQALAR